MATNMAPHNLVEVIQALRHLIAHPDTDLDGLMRFIPGPDLPTGGKIIGLDGIRDAYETGRGSFRMRATARIETVGAAQGHRGHRDAVRRRARRRSSSGSRCSSRARSSRASPTSRTSPTWPTALRLVIEVKNGFVPEAILEQLYKLTPMEESFGINNVCLVDGQPRTLGLKELLEVFLEHRYDVVRRRSTFRRDKKADRLHLVDGLLIALLDIDEVIQVIRTSDDAAPRRGAADVGLRPVRDPGQLHPRHAAAPADQVQPDRAGEGAGDAAPRDRGARGDPGRRGAAQEGRLRRAGRGRQDLRHPAPHRPARVRGHRRHRDRRAARGRRRPVLRVPVLQRPARPHVERRAGRRGRRAAPTTTWSSPRCPPRPAARSAWSPAAAGCSSCPCSTCRRCRPRPTTRTSRAATRSASWPRWSPASGRSR